ncbi:hypothetical protein AGMMS49936_11920 [Endomicrobiia bacterium]|nr:hypothetical protein AGMMS49936_11920 [Endomicrobiia bacterium]
MEFTRYQFKKRKSLKAICVIIVFSLVLSSCPGCPSIDDVRHLQDK